MEKILRKILDYQAEHKVDDDSILIMLSLLDLMGMVDLLKREGENDAAGAGLNSGFDNIEALLGPLMVLMASGGGKNNFNPAALLSLLAGGLGGSRRGGAPDPTALLRLLGPLMGMAGAGQQSRDNTEHTREPGNKPQPLQREINLDHKHKTSVPGTVITVEKKNERLPKAGEVLKWKFGT